MPANLHFRVTKPDKSLSDFVESFWMLHNPSASEKEIVVLPDGRVDLIFSQSASDPFRIILSGIETYPDKATLPAKSIMFAVSFKLPAMEYIFKSSISSLLNYAAFLPVDFWNFNSKDLKDFDFFCKKAAEKIQSLVPSGSDQRKLKLFDLIYSSKGSLTVKELSEKVFWNSRQINRYFNQQYGLSLKAYCNILRFRASLEYLAKGKLFPELKFADQSHFIKEIKKFSGVVPKELLKNKNDRFIQFSVLTP